MKFKTKIKSTSHVSHSALILVMAFLAGMSILGCRTTPPVCPEKPLEVVFFVQADKPRWQDTCITIKRGQVVHCIAEGKWSDLNGTYSPQGNPQVLKDHLGLSAPANALLMKINYHTNAYLPAQIVCVGKEKSVIAKSTGVLLFANNVSLPIDQQGEIKVTITVASDTDEDGLSDYEEITRWKTDPQNPDSDGDGFRDDKEVTAQKARHKKKTISPLLPH